MLYTMRWLAFGSRTTTPAGASSASSIQTSPRAILPA